jgi:hypothetical protein
LLSGRVVARPYRQCDGLSLVGQPVSRSTDFIRKGAAGKGRLSFVWAKPNGPRGATLRHGSDSSSRVEWRDAADGAERAGFGAAAGGGVRGAPPPIAAGTSGADFSLDGG